jgi:N-methylhydantoinase A
VKTVAIDIGGTFTDLAAIDLETGELSFAKRLTTPPEFERGALDCLSHAAVPSTDIESLRHGTTVAINSLLERQGARTALVTTAGFRDLLDIGRGNRPEAFNLFYSRLPPLVPRNLRFEVPERMSATGDVVRPVDEAELATIAQRLTELKIEAVAICLLHSWRNPRHEQQIADYLRRNTNCFVSSSHEISMEFREYERTSTVVMNAFVGPRVANYLDRLGGRLREDGFSGRLYLMGSNGGVLSEDEARTRPLLLVESGPVGGVAGAAEIGAAMGLPNLVAFDMGGTTAKATMIENGEAAVTPIYWVGGYDRGLPVQAAVIDIVEVGAGGGSIAELNELNGLRVGPRSASSVPGPACYGRGGTEPTITDANLVLGRLDGDRFLGGDMKLRRDLAEDALAALGRRLDISAAELAAGMLKIATVTMATTVRKVTIERGHDPRDFAMVAFGGAGPLHAVDVAREIGMRRVIIPPMPGHFSAFGMLFADFREDLVETLASPLATVDLAELDSRFAALEENGRQQLQKLGLKITSLHCHRYAEMRYQRQEYTVKVRLPDKVSSREEIYELFEEAYRTRYGHATRHIPVDLVMLRVVVEGRTPRGKRTARAEAGQPGAAIGQRQIWFQETGAVTAAVWRRDTLTTGQRVSGPAVIEEDASTTVLAPGDVATADRWGNIDIELGGAS